MKTFQDLGLSEKILTTVANLGYEAPMPIQERVIPFILSEEEDLVGLAQTGTGKTAAFRLPIIQRPVNCCVSVTHATCITIWNWSGKS